MRYRRTADKVLKLYARELMKVREADYDAFVGQTTPAYLRISPKHMMKRCISVAIVLTLSFALLIVSANALGIKIFGFDIFQKSNHAEIVPNEYSQGEHIYFEPKYIPKGYEEIESGSVNPDQKSYVYANQKDELLTIVESFSEDLGITLNNENCDYHVEIVQEYEVHIYDYEGGYSTWLFQKEGTFILIYGPMEKSEFEKILRGLE